MSSQPSIHELWSNIYHTYYPYAVVMLDGYNAAGRRTFMILSLCSKDRRSNSESLLSEIPTVDREFLLREYPNRPLPSIFNFRKIKFEILRSDCYKNDDSKYLISEILTGTFYCSHLGTSFEREGRLMITPRDYRFITEEVNFPDDKMIKTDGDQLYILGEGGLTKSCQHQDNY